MQSEAGEFDCFGSSQPVLKPKEEMPGLVYPAKTLWAIW
jgi:hypothetical protein